MSMNPGVHSWHPILFAAALSPLTALGQIMLSPAQVTGTDLGTFSPESPLVNLINQTGLDRSFVSDATDFDTYFAVPHQAFATNGATNNWQSDLVSTEPPKGYVDFDLGASRQVSKIAIWNITAKEVDIALSEDPAGLAAAPAAGSFLLTNHASYPFSYPVDVLVLAFPQQGRYLRLSINSAFPLVPGFNFIYVILGEVVVSVAPIATPGLLIAREPNGDIQVTFGGTLQAAATADGFFVDVPGNPRGTYTVSQGSLAGQQFFRAVGP